MTSFPITWIPDHDPAPPDARPVEAPAMPEISRFFGIAIAMYSEDHVPPRVHAFSGAATATIDIATGAVDGHFPPRALGLVQEWRERYQADLLENWRRARLRLPLRAVPPLE